MATIGPEPFDTLRRALPKGLFCFFLGKKPNRTEFEMAQDTNPEE
jgi:hypothetical protein